MDASISSQADIDTVRANFNCKTEYNERHPSGNGTIFHDNYAVGQAMVEPAIRRMGLKMVVNMNLSEANGNPSDLDRLQTIFEGGSDVDFGMFQVNEERQKIINFGFPLRVGSTLKVLVLKANHCTCM